MTVSIAFALRSSWLGRDFVDFRAGGTALAKKNPPAQPIDLNTARRRKELEQLPGVGPTTAKAIVRVPREGRADSDASTDLLVIRGISEAKLEKDAALHHGRDSPSKVTTETRVLPRLFFHGLAQQLGPSFGAQMISTY